MKRTKRPTAIPSELAEELHRSQWLISSIWGESGPGLRSIPALLILLWLSIERLRRELQTSASRSDWKSSDAGVIAQGRLIGLDARPGESMADFRSRVEREVQRGR